MQIYHVETGVTVVHAGNVSPSEGPFALGVLVGSTVLSSVDNVAGKEAGAMV